jgi:hypothetical protein
MSSIKLKLFSQINGDYKELIAINDASKLSGKPKRTLQYAIEKRKAPTTYKIGGVLYFLRQEFDTWSKQ